MNNWITLAHLKPRLHAALAAYFTMSFHNVSKRADLEKSSIFKYSVSECCYLFGLKSYLFCIYKLVETAVCLYIIYRMTAILTTPKSRMNINHTNSTLNILVYVVLLPMTWASCRGPTLYTINKF